MIFLDLFSGVGGFRLELESEGHECIGFCDNDKFARASYKAISNTEGEKEYHDIRNVSDEEWREFRGKCDLICACFPCQSFSIAGKRRGFLDKTRSTLFFEIARAIKQIQPRLLLLENVKGLLSQGGGRLLELSSPPLWGTMSNGRYLTAKISACRNTENACILSDILEEKVDEKYFLSKERCEKFIWKNERIGVLPYKTGKLPQRCKVVRENGLSPTLLASNAYEPQMVAIRNNSPNKPFLAAQNGDNISLQPNARGSVRKGYSGTITTSPDAVLDDWRIRKLTPRECWRLQSMPEWAFDRAQKVCSDQQLYKQAGNGVTVNVVREIAKKLK